MPVDKRTEALLPLVQKPARYIGGELGSVVKGIRVRHLYPLCRCAHLTAKEYESVKDLRVFDLIMQCVVNMQCGDGQYTPDTPVYRFMMGFAAAADSVIDTQPFFDVKKKLKGYSIREIVEPMLFNNGVPDNEAQFDFTVLPAERVPTARFTSHAGEILMAALSALALAVSPLSPAVTAAAIPALTILKKRKNRKHPVSPERY